MGRIAAFFLACAPALANACTAAEICATASDYTPDANAADTCFNDGTYTTYNYNTLDPTCSGCTFEGPEVSHSTQEDCEGAGYTWNVATCSQSAGSMTNYCGLLQGLAEDAGYSCCGSGGAPVAEGTCTAADICGESDAADYRADAAAGGSCCNDAMCTTLNYVEIDPACPDCTTPSYTTKETCEAAGKMWYVAACSEVAPDFAGCTTCAGPRTQFEPCFLCSLAPRSLRRSGRGLRLGGRLHLGRDRHGNMLQQCRQPRLR